MRNHRGYPLMNRGPWPIAAILALIVLWPLPAKAQEGRVIPDSLLKPRPRVPIYDPGNPVMKKVLKNGVTILVQEQRTGSTVAGAVALRMGTYYETDEDAGRSQVLIHSITAGTRRYSPVELQLQILAAGATVEASVGADLGQITINTKREQVQRAADLLADIALEPSFPDTAVENTIQRRLAIAAWENEGPLKAAYSMFLGAMYQGSPMARPVAGTVTAISECHRRDVVDLHKRFFVGNNMIVAFVGNFDGKKLMTQLEKRFAAAPPGPPPTPAGGDPVPLATDTTVTAEREILANAFVYGFPAPGYEHPDYAAFKIIESHLASGDRSSIAFWLPQYELAAGVGVIYAPYPRRSSIAVYLAATPANFETARDTVLTVMNRLKEMPLDESEWMTQLKRVQNGQFLNQNDPMVRARSMSQFEAAGVGYDFPRRFEESLLKLNTESVRAAAERWFTHSCEAVLSPPKGDSKL